MTAMATSRPSRARRRWPILAIAVGAALAVAGCGGATAKPFTWLRPADAPPGWALARLPTSAATLAYPPGWRPIVTDQGTASAAQIGSGGAILGYLNATPRQGAESLSNWPSFRIHHMREEGSREVKLLASATGIRFRSGHGSCVLDEYRNAATRYREIACLVAGARASTVIVGAAPADRWSREAPAIQPAIASFTT